MRTVHRLLTAATVSSTLLLAACSPEGASVARNDADKLPVSSSFAPGQTFDGRVQHFQTMSGLGVNANVHSWDDGRLKPAIDRIVDLGEVTWRVIIEKADWESEQEPVDPSTVDWGRYKALYDHGKMADLWDTIGYINSKPGQQVMVNVMGAVPDWMGGDHIEAAREDQWVQMIASMVAYGRTVRHLNFTLLGPMNESDLTGIEGPHVEPDQYVRLLHKLLVRLAQFGIADMQLVGPDTGSAAKGNSDYLPALASDPLVMEKIAHYGIHSYDGSSAEAREALDRSSHPGMDYWVTEFAAWCPGCDTGSPNPADWSYAASTGSLAIKLLEQGAGGLLQYDAWDGYYEHHGSMGYWGLLAYDSEKGTYSPRKTYFVLRQLIRYTPRNAVRIAASSSEGSVDIVAFQDPVSGRVSIFGRNSSDAPVKATLRVAGVSGTMQLSMFTTDAGRDMEAAEGTLLADGSTNLWAQPNSVFTLTGTSTKG
jgi:hypothetical protein